eukprot:gene19295-25155_t
MLQAFYAKMNEGGTAKLKADATFFSIADGIVQHMFIDYLLSGDKFGQIVGEEDETAVNILTKPYTVDDLTVPSEFEEVIESTLEAIKFLSSRISSTTYKKLTVFVDPIDGTREFATGLGDCVTVLIGYNDEFGKPVAGIMYRPLTKPATWAAGAASENYALGVLDLPETPNPNGLLITDGKVTPFLNKAIEELGFNKVPSLASGNRAMMILEGKAGAYIRDTGGFAKWDTSGPQAVFEAYGGTMSKLPEFLIDKSLASYNYHKSPFNTDFQENVVELTLSNARNKDQVIKGEKVIATIDMVKEYSCLCGLVALDKSNMSNLDKIHSALKTAQAAASPTYT